MHHAHSRTLSCLVMLACTIASSVTAQTVDFGNVVLGDWRDSSVTVTNTLPVPVTVTSIAMLHTPSDWTITSGNNTPFTVLPNATHTIGLHFYPTQAGLRTDTVLVVTSLAAIPVTVLGTGIPLPVELERFSATALDDGVHIRWETATESNNAGFDLQRAHGVPDDAHDGGAARAHDFMTIAHVPGHGTTQARHVYSFKDNTIGISDVATHVYRLRQIDFDGSVHVCAEITVSTDGRSAPTSPRIAELLPPVPNPFTATTMLQYMIARPAHVTLTVHDAIGREVARLHDGLLEAGSHALSFRAGMLPAGVYFARLVVDDAHETVRLVHTNQ